MAISNKTGAMVVTTGNKSEMSVGYATLYGDMNGGFNPIKDIYKTEVFRLSTPAQFMEAGRRARAHPARSFRSTSSRGRRPRSCAKTRPTRIRCRPTTCSMRILERLVEREEPLAVDRRRRFRSRRGGADRSPAQHRRIQAAAGGARRQGDADGISAATAAIPSPTGFAMPASRCPNPTRRWCRAPAADRRKRSRARR